MNIKGFDIQLAHEEACLKVMGRAFKLEDVIGAAMDAGVPRVFPQPGSDRPVDIASLFARRMVSREVEAGRYVQDGNIWSRCD